MPHQSKGDILSASLGNRRFGSVRCYVSTVGGGEATNRKYIREQEHAYKMRDKLLAKEYTDPISPKLGKLLEERVGNMLLRS